jgi:hypothetical protein
VRGVRGCRPAARVPERDRRRTPEATAYSLEDPGRAIEYVDCVVGAVPFRRRHDLERFVAVILVSRRTIYTRTRFTHHDCCLVGRAQPRSRQTGNTLGNSFVSGCITTDGHCRTEQFATDVRSEAASDRISRLSVSPGFTYVCPTSPVQRRRRRNAVRPPLLNDAVRFLGFLARSVHIMKTTKPRWPEVEAWSVIPRDER